MHSSYFRNKNDAGENTQFIFISNANFNSFFFNYNRKKLFSNRNKIIEAHGIYLFNS